MNGNPEIAKMGIAQATGLWKEKKYGLALLHLPTGV